MSALSSWLRSAVRTIKPGRRPAPARKNRVHLSLEALETREVPTVAFTPHFSGTAVTPPAGTTLAQEEAASLKSPDVVIIFAGSDWVTGQGPANEQTLLTSIKAILSSKYLSGLQQYGSDGNANFFSSWQTNSAVNLTQGLPGSPNFMPSDSDLHTFVNDQIASEKKINASLVPSATAIYFVINDPTDSKGGGCNSLTGSAVRAAYVGATNFSNGRINQDGFTMAFSHELAESMADEIHVNDPGNLNLSFQICDNEPEAFGNGYGYRINGGTLVQAYWSQSNNAWVVPDGNSQVVTLSWSSTTFNNVFNLTAYGDQPPFGANYNDTFTLDLAPTTTGQRLTLNNQAFSFDNGQLNLIYLYTEGGSNTVNLKYVPFGESVYVDSLSSTSNDTVVVGNNGSLSGITGPISVANSSGGKTALQVTAYADPPTNIKITSGSVTVGGIPIYYTPYAGPSSSVYGVTSVTISDAYGANQIDAESVPAYVPVTVVGNYFDNLFGPAAGQVTLKRIPYHGGGWTTGGGTTTNAPGTP
jgi:hypothetical protein